jgi:4-hydroxy-tetrahydrodipicolinate reductase
MEVFVPENKINIFLVGYGKMGRIIHDNASFINGYVVGIYDTHIPEHNKPIDELDFYDIDVVIEFTRPDSAFDNVKKLLKKNVPVVTGTTGWFHKIDSLKKSFNFNEHTLVYGANFSIGMNILYEIVEESTRFINQTGLYDVYGYETHHRAKAESPSGTARVLSDIIIKNTTSKEKAVFDLNNKPLNDNEFSFSSIRAGNVVGYHEIGFDSDFDDIKLIHSAKSRKGFAIGTLLAAKYALNHKGLFNFKDIFKSVFND